MPKTEDAAPPLKPFYHKETGEILHARQLDRPMAIQLPWGGIRHGGPGDYLVRERSKDYGEHLEIRGRKGFEAFFEPGRRPKDNPNWVEPDPPKVAGQVFTTEELGKRYAPKWMRKKGKAEAPPPPEESPSE
jgi:hypothetical protein